MHLDEQSWTVPEVFQLIQSAGVDETEMLRTFNMGIGYVLVVSAQEAPKVMGTLEAEGQAACVIGHLGVDG